MSGLEEVQGFSVQALRDNVIDRHRVLADIRSVCERLCLIPVGMLGHSTKYVQSHRVVGFRIQDRSFHMVEVWPNGAWLLDTAKYRVLLACDERETAEAVQSGSPRTDSAAA